MWRMKNEFTHEISDQNNGSGMAQRLYVAVTQGSERRFEFSEGYEFIHPGLPLLGNSDYGSYDGAERRKRLN